MCLAECYKLPLGDPPIKSFVRWIHLLSITCHSDATEGWLLNNFINLACTTDYGRRYSVSNPERQMVLDFWHSSHPGIMVNNPFVQSREVWYDDTASGLTSDSIVEQAITALKEGIYPSLFVDEGRFSFSTEYASGNVYPHRVLLHGASTKTKTFNAFALGTCSRNRIYGRLDSYAVTFDDLRDASKNVVNGVLRGVIPNGPSFMIRRLSTRAVTEIDGTVLDIALVRRSIADYLECRSAKPDQTTTRQYAYGHDVFEELARYFRRVTSNEIADNCRRDVRHLHVIHEHHNLMSQRLCTINMRANDSRIDTVAKAFTCLASELQLLKIRLMMRSNWRGPGDFSAIASNIEAIGSRTRSLMERAFLELGRIA
jgi:hypothetical protein